MKLFQFLLLILLLSSCATNPAKKPAQKLINIPQVKSIGIISDICLERYNVIANDYFSIEDSKLAEQYILESTKKHLEQKGYKVNFTIYPFVCSFKSSDEAFKVAKKEGANVSDAYSPFYISELFDNDKEYEYALITVITQAHKSSSTTLAKKLSSSNEKIQESLKIIAERTNTETLLILTGEGEIVSTRKLVMQAITNFSSSSLYGIASQASLLSIVSIPIILGGGIISGAIFDDRDLIQDVSYLNLDLNLIDIKNVKLLLSMSSYNKRIDPIDRDFYIGESSYLLSPIPDRKKPQYKPHAKSQSGVSGDKDESLIQSYM